jgi:cytochrome P450 / NADPH-cytochrome P450 reductase
MYLLTNPHTYLKAQREVDEVIGSRAIEPSDLSKLKYLNAVLREAARLSPTVPVLQKSIQPELASQINMLAGKYQILPDDRLVVLLAKAQTDPKVWGDTAREFEPERMLDENFDAIMAQYPGSWKVSILSQSWPCLTESSHSGTASVLALDGHLRGKKRH